LVRREIGVFPVLLATMDSTAFLDSLALPAPLVLLALAETSLLKWVTQTTLSHLALLSLAQWVQWVPVVLLDLLALPVLRVSLDPQASLVSPALLVPWVLAAPLVPLARTEMMVSPARLVAPESVDPLALRALADSPALLDSPASRDTEVSAVWMELRETAAPLVPRERLARMVRTVLLEPWVHVVFLVREAAPDPLAPLVLVVTMATPELLDPLDLPDLLEPLASPVVLELRERLALREAVETRDPREPVVSPVTPDLLAQLALLVTPDLMVLLVPRVALALLALLVPLASPEHVDPLEPPAASVPPDPKETAVSWEPLDPEESLVPRESLVPLDLRDLPATMARREREAHAVSPVVPDPVDLLESVAHLVLAVSPVLTEVLVAREPPVSVVPTDQLEPRELPVRVDAPASPACPDPRE